MISIKEFVNKWVGSPWSFHGTSLSGVDCWGLVVVYYRDVLGIELSNHDECEEITEGYESQLSDGNWIEVEKPEKNTVFMSFIGSLPVHVGVCLSPSEALHSRGSVNEHGCVSVNSIHALKRTFGYKMKFYKYVVDNG